VENLPGIVRDGLLSDALMAARGGPTRSIGMTNIKAARLAKEMPCYPAHTVGEFVPLNFCPRSVMLYVVSMGDHPGLGFRGGQGQIVHLQYDLHQLLDWADRAGKLWAFTAGNARAGYTSFHTDRAQLGAIDWDAVDATDWRDPFVKDSKQAEVLIHEVVPFELVESIGVRSADVAATAQAGLSVSKHKPPVVVERTWYY
jgi:hypothetical protein